MSVTATIECHDGVTRKFWGEGYRDLLVSISRKLEVPLAQLVSPPLTKAIITAETVTPRQLAASAGVMTRTAHSRLARAVRYGQAERLGRGLYRVTTQDDVVLTDLLAPNHPGHHWNGDSA